MKQVNPNEAPPGMVAVKSNDLCTGCHYYGDSSGCPEIHGHLACSDSVRRDECEVIFQKAEPAIEPRPDPTPLSSPEQCLAGLAKKREELAAQIAQIDAGIADHKAKLRADALASIQAQMLEHGISAAELEPVKPAGDEVVRYADGAGNTWDGSGQMPMWMMKQYAVECYRRGRAGEPRLSERDFAERFRLGGAA